jgi:hypothetical protein
MIEQIVFVLTALMVIYGAFFPLIAAVFGNDVNVPVPILHLIGLDFTNAYFYMPASAYQIYFWSQPLFV